MAKKGKHHHAAVLASPAELQPRIERASRDGRFQQALELAKQLYKYEPTPAHKDLLLKTYLGRARQLRGTGYLKDAVTVIHAGLQHADSDVAWLEQAALELSACGDARGASDFLARLPEDSPARARIRAQAVDAAITHGAASRTALAPDLQPDFDRILQAFAQVQAGQDEAASTTLQGIGLRSPFLDWKVLLRGLLAYYQQDDARAVDNWQRLDATRLPARLAAPLRYLIDRPYRDAQTPEAQGALSKQADRLQGEPALEPLRALQKALADQHSLTQAFRLAESVLPLLRVQAPQLVARLASCFYWTVITTGRPEDVPRFGRVFGAPADDPNFSRLRALAYDHVQEFQDAHKEWQAFEKSVAANPGAWPSGQADRVRALVWSHMGSNAAAQPDLEDPDLPPFLRNHPNRPRPLKPTAEKCFEESLKLAPDVLETHVHLVDLYAKQRKPRKAEEAARRLLERFPEHVPTLQKLAALRIEACDYPDGITLLERATRLNPLDRVLRSRLAQAHLFHARAEGEAGRYDTARAKFQTALALSEASNVSSVYCKWAACEFKAGDGTRAEELLNQAVAQAGSRLAVAYSMLIEVIRMRLTKQKKRFNDEFNRLLAEPADGAAAVALAELAAAHKAAGVTYHGQKTHEKKVFAYLQKAAGQSLAEEQMERICKALADLENHKVLAACASAGRHRFPKNPWFPFYEAEACFMQGPFSCPGYRVRPLLAEVRRLAQASRPIRAAMNCSNRCRNAKCSPPAPACWAASTSTCSTKPSGTCSTTRMDPTTIGRRTP